MVKIEPLETKEEKVSYLRKISKDLEDYLSILDSVSYAIVVLNKGKTIYGNTALENLLGYSIEEIIDLDCRTEEDKKLSDESLTYFDEDRKRISYPEHTVINLKCKDGTYMYVELCSKTTSVRDYELTVITLNQFLPPSEKRELAKRNYQLYMVLVEFSPNAIIVRSEHEIIYVNNAAVELLGAGTKKNVIGKMPNEFLEIDDSDNKNVLDGKQMKYSCGRINAYEQSMVRKCDGKHLDLELLATLIPYENKMVSLVFARDISERKIAEEFKQTIVQQQFMLDKAHEYDKLRTEFFSNVSHDLRTPLNVMLSSLQMLNIMMKEDSFIEKKDKFINYIEMMTQNSKRMLKIINNIIDMARIDTGFMQLYIHNYNIVEVIEDITLMVVEYARNKGITIQFDTEIEELIMACDKDKIERVMLNLLSNAVKFTSEGGRVLVYMSTNLKADKVYISVKDDGIGISKEKHDWIFQRFAQEDNSLTRMDEGSGIGLSIVQSLVEMHNGNVTLVSQPGKGSEFIVELPVRMVDEDEEMLLHTIDNKVNETRVDVEFSDVTYL